ncbi:MAG: GNAT family N-acetyltransferase [Flavobacterium sp.]
MNSYKVLNNQVFSNENYSIVPIRFEDRMDIMKWRNEQIYHLRQNKPLTEDDQNRYFDTVVKRLFEEEQPNQLLFSYLEGEKCIGYGGLVHINWIDKNAEISFVMNTALEKDEFQKHWVTYLGLIEQLAFKELKLHKIYTYAFDLRPLLYDALEVAGFYKEAILKEHCLFQGEYKDVVIHSKCNYKKDLLSDAKLFLREALEADAKLLFDWANEFNVRNNSISQEHIVWENHLKWFKNKLNHLDSEIFILTDGSELLGQIRIDKNDSYWEIDYSIDYKHRGKGFGKQIVKLLLEKFVTYKFKAIVRRENLASIKVFNSLGFIKGKVESTDFDYFEY